MWQLQGRKDEEEMFPKNAIHYLEHRYDMKDAPLGTPELPGGASG